ncbi:MAG: hypothetical protein RJQ09_06810 [Cyclobacteriaceae bacterium]
MGKQKVNFQSASKGTVRVTTTGSGKTYSATIKTIGQTGIQRLVEIKKGLNDNK